ncbi:thiol reductant ABC exporter subunit CydD [Dactylosporangium sp. AC04546]|uniref:thiol reductant ABC exporter subunit CydD n=1 Tax=Dactylosporangium sp. AC04546 TaxID=2862460 RepID=UPI001EDE9E7A|nr:thiol reductant ABC exporter subunit CydD [Dactylosporangium sp. AC04546]WVK80150.1 thiol reductant ABC exporter subunit CydD [Dactylosporangium sp. AC04546]
MRPLDPRLLRYASATRAYLALSVVLGVALAALVVAQATLLADGIVAVYLGGASLAALTPTLGWLAAVVAARAAVAWAQEVAAARSAAAVKRQLRARLFAHVVALGPGARRSGDVVTLATRGLDALDAYFARYLPQLVLAALVPAIVLTRIAPADLVAAATIAVTLPLIPVFMILVGRHTEAANRRQFRLLARLSHHFLDVVAGLPTLRVFGRARRQAAIVAEISTQQRRVTMRTLRVAFLSSLVLELLATLSVALVAVGIGLRLVDGELSLATALLVLILAPEAYLPLRQVGANYHASAEGLAAATEAFDLLETPPPASGTASEGTGAAPAGPVGAIRFEGAVVRHEGRAEPSLPSFTAEVRPGELVALTGPSGCGKSTALAVLLGFAPLAAGRIQVGGTDLATLDLTAWRRQVAWLPQRPWLGAGTIAEAIRLGAPDAPDAALRTAAARAGALDFIEALPAGFATPLGDGGAGLSAGQRQRIALARVFLRDAPVVLLDEPTAGLDAGTEASILSAIRTHAEGRTVILVAHRPSLVALADREIAFPAPRTLAAVTP